MAIAFSVRPAKTRPSEENTPSLRPGPDHLDGDRSVERKMPGPVDDTHAASAQLPKDFITGQHRQ
jgi:hypothetical protein